MEGVNVLEKLYPQYRLDHWMYQRKWWRSIFLWGLGVAAKNVYILYRKTCDRANQNKQKVASEEDTLNHQKFLEYLDIQLIWIEDSSKKINTTGRHLLPSFHLVLL